MEKTVRTCPLQFIKTSLNQKFKLNRLRQPKVRNKIKQKTEAMIKKKKKRRPRAKTLTSNSTRYSR